MGQSGGARLVAGVRREEESGPHRGATAWVAIAVFKAHMSNASFQSPFVKYMVRFIWFVPSKVFSVTAIVLQD